MTLVVFLASALLCASDRCYPALVGRDTPVGHYPLVRRFVQADGYGGDVLQFKATDAGVLAVHRVWLGRPPERRLERLTDGDASDRRFVTNGCINVMPDVYLTLVDADALDVFP